jgi:hypothetical protein
MTAAELALILADHHESMAAHLRAAAEGDDDAAAAGITSSPPPILGRGDALRPPAAGTATAATRRVAAGNVPGRDRPWTHVDDLGGQTHRWPEGTAHFERFEIYETADALGTVRIAIAYADQDAINLGKHPRAYLMTFLVVGMSKRDPIVLFTATDDHDQTGDWVAIIKGKGPNGNEMFAHGDELPAPYAGMQIDGYRDRVDQPYRANRLAVVAPGGDTDVILDHALIQLRLRFK